MPGRQQGLGRGAGATRRAGWQCRLGCSCTAPLPVLRAPAGPPPARPGPGAATAGAHAAPARNQGRRWRGWRSARHLHGARVGGEGGRLSGGNHLQLMPPVTSPLSPRQPLHSHLRPGGRGRARQRAPGASHPPAPSQGSLHRCRRLRGEGTGRRFGHQFHSACMPHAGTARPRLSSACKHGWCERQRPPPGPGAAAVCRSAPPVRLPPGSQAWLVAADAQMEFDSKRRLQLVMTWGAVFTQGPQPRLATALPARRHLGPRPRAAAPRSGRGAAWAAAPPPHPARPRRPAAGASWQTGVACSGGGGASGASGGRRERWAMPAVPGPPWTRAAGCLGAVGGTPAASSACTWCRAGVRWSTRSAAREGLSVRSLLGDRNEPEQTAVSCTAAQRRPMQKSPSGASPLFC